MMEKQSCIKWIQPGSFYRQKQVRFIKVLQKMLKLKQCVIRGKLKFKNYKSSLEATQLEKK